MAKRLPFVRRYHFGGSVELSGLASPSGSSLSKSEREREFWERFDRMVVFEHGKKRPTTAPFARSLVARLSSGERAGGRKVHTHAYRESERERPEARGPCLLERACRLLPLRTDLQRAAKLGEESARWNLFASALVARASATASESAAAAPMEWLFARAFARARRTCAVERVRMRRSESAPATAAEFARGNAADDDGANDYADDDDDCARALAEALPRPRAS